MDSKQPKVSDILEDALTWMRSLKSDQRTEVDRYIAICITDLEKVKACWKDWVEHPDFQWGGE